MKPSNEKGAALILTMIFVLVLTILAASLLFLSQSETWSGLNYRLMTQARYGAEAGVHAAANFLANPATYTPPTTATDPITGYLYKGVSPVTAGGNPVVLGAVLNGVSVNYPDATVKSNFATATSGSLTAGNNTVAYSTSAQLVSMRTVTLCGNLQPLTAQVWKLTSHGDVAGVRNAEVEVTSLLESQVLPCYNYAAFATANGCSSISFNGRGAVDSYDSSNLAAGIQQYDGNLGSNGNVNTANNTVIAGSFSSPDTGVGACSAGGIDALTGNINALTGCETAAQKAANTCSGGSAAIIKLAQTINFPTPVIPSTVPTPVSAVPGSLSLTPCGGASACPGAAGNYGDLNYAGNNHITLNPYVSASNVCSSGVYYINSIQLSGNADVTIAPCPATSTTPGVYQPIIINIVGNGQATPLSLSGNGLTNTSLNPAMAQFQYAGTGTVNLSGNGSSAGVLYAPNADVNFNGNADWYGSMITGKVHSNGNGAIHYDRRLAADLMTVSNWTLDSFSWTKF
jgi:Tfp pilus assembly protein PilX